MNALSLQFAESFAIVVFDQPGSKVNVLRRETWSEMEAVFQQLAVRTDLHGLVLESAKPGVFIAGADLKELSDVPGPDHPGTRQFIEQGLRVLESLESLPFPTVACVDGAALGGGLEVALACDFRIAGTNAKTRFGLPELTLGLIPGWGGTQRLPRLIGVTSAIEQMLGREPFDAENARYRGLATRIVPSENLRSEAFRLLAEAQSTRSWRGCREKKQRAMEIDRSEATIQEMNEGQISEAKFNAMSLSAEAIAAFRLQIDEQLAQSPIRPAAHALLNVIENGCKLPLGEAIAVETQEFLRLAGSSEARQLIAEFFASRKK
jgi:enoyl-CoA hydratase